jgi:PAS domain-containing protein
MEKPQNRSTMPVFVLLISLMVGVDVLIDRLGGHTWISSLVHITFGFFVILSAHVVLRRAAESRRKAEALLHQTKDELEAQVRNRTADLNLANETLRTEISEHEQADVERDRLIAQIETARQRAENLVAELHLANNMLVTLIDTLPAGMIIIDVEGRIVLAKSHARALMKSALAGDTYGLRDELTLRHPDGMAIAQEDLPLVRAIQYGEVTKGLEVECCLEDGGCVDLLIAASPVKDENGKIRVVPE